MIYLLVNLVTSIFILSGLIVLLMDDNHPL